VLVPDALGVRKDVVLGYDHLEAWVSGKPWFNSIVGRHANRIAEGKFHLDGETFQLERNNLGNNVGYTEHSV
jgi:aldose 1-epimerase